jgi:predicted RecB family nuclease
MAESEARDKVRGQRMRRAAAGRLTRHGLLHFAITSGHLAAFSRASARQGQQERHGVLAGGRIMATKITSDVLESYLHCKFKGYLKLAGQQGTKCDFEAMVTELRAEVRLKAIDTIIARYPGDQVARNIPLAAAGLKRGPLYILDGTLEDGALALHFDGLKRVEGASKLGDFQYVPVLFQEGEKVRKEQRLLLAVYGLLLSGLQGRAPQNGVVWHGRECKATRININCHRVNAEKILQDLKEMTGAESAPRLFLNDHCQVCEFRERCNAQAVEEDNLSLLLGMGEKQISAYNRKGFFTVTQISHTFRYRKPRKRAKVHEYPHYYSLQARSIRTGLIHLHGSPSLPKTGTKVYLDIEGIPDRDLYYLIGAAVETGESVTYHSFWADEEANQEDIFLRFAALVGSLPNDCVILHYGSYEPTAFKKMQERVQPERRAMIQAVVAKLVNVLSVVHRHVYFPTYSNGLKDIAKLIGHAWTDATGSGIQSICWRNTWERTREPSVKERLVTYNREDCMALRRIFEFMQCAETMKPGAETQDSSLPSIMPTSSLPKPRQKWPTYGRATFSLSDLERASECAYFDYQRQRVYVRTNKRFKQINRRCKKPRVPFTPNKRIVIECSICPACGGTKLQEEVSAEAKDSGSEVPSGRRKEMDCGIPLMGIQVPGMWRKFSTRGMAKRPFAISVRPCLLVRLPEHRVQAEHVSSAGNSGRRIRTRRAAETAVSFQRLDSGPISNTVRGDPPSHSARPSRACR